MKKFFRMVWVVVMAAAWSAPAFAGEVFEAVSMDDLFGASAGPDFAGGASLRFVWPADANNPGRGLVPLSGSAESAEAGDTPIGRAQIRNLVWRDIKGDPVLKTRMLKLADTPGVYLIELTILREIPAPTGDYYLPHAGLPAIAVPAGFDRVLTYKVDAFAPPTDQATATSGPVLLYNDGLDAMVFSPLDNFLAAMQRPEGGWWLCGFGGTIERVPAGTTHRVLLVSGHGVRSALLKWGDALRGFYGHERPSAYADVGLAKLGYWTDNGGYYYYKTAPKMNYHETLLAVEDDAKMRGIPYGYFQLDSWWYPKAKTNNLLNAFRGGSLLWEPIPELFPRGLPAFQKELGLPLIAHNRWYNQDTPYCGRYECVYGHGDKRPALPITPSFWDEIMDNAKSCGVAVYEQDWLVTQMNMIPWLRSGFHNAEQWFDTMAAAAFARGMTMQLCMASPEFFLQQVKHPNVTQVRCSGDYHAGIAKTYYWPAFHQTSMLAYAVGLWPFKDNFQSAPGQRLVRSEKWPFEEALISNLSAGLVGPSDKIGAADPELLMRTCRQDGVLLKPDLPAMPIDLMFLDTQKPWIVTTKSSHDIGDTIYLAAFNLWPARMNDPSVSLADLGLEGGYVIYDWRKHEVVVGADRIEFGKMGINDAFYYVLCPMQKGGMALLGETGKFVTVSNKRFPEIRHDGDRLKLAVAGAPGEVVPVSAYGSCMDKAMMGCRMPESRGVKEGVITIKVTIPESGRTVVYFD